MAEWIYRLRTDVYDMTQEDFAREVGVAHNTITRWETDARTPRGATLTLLKTIAVNKGFEPPPESPSSKPKLRKADPDSAGE